MGEGESAGGWGNKGEREVGMVSGRSCGRGAGDVAGVVKRLGGFGVGGARWKGV